MQTAVNCLEQLLACRFSLVVVDEAHHSVASSYTQLLKGLGCVQEVEVHADSEPRDHRDSSTAGSSSDEDIVLVSCSGSSSSSSGSSSRSNISGLRRQSSATKLQAVYSPHMLLVGFTATPYR